MAQMGKPPGKRATTDSRSTVRWAATVTAGIFLLVGILGFVPGITADYDQLGFAGHESQANLLGLFQVSVLHNIVHLLFGIVGLALARTSRGAFLFLVGGGLIYLVLWLYGLVIEPTSAANFVPLNSADNWLHLGLGLGMIGLGIVFRPTASPPATSPSS